MWELKLHTTHVIVCMCVITQTKLLCLLIPVYQKNEKTLWFFCEGNSGFDQIINMDWVLCANHNFNPPWGNLLPPIIYIWDSYSRTPPLPKTQNNMSCLSPHENNSWHGVYFALYSTMSLNQYKIHLFGEITGLLVQYALIWSGKSVSNNQSRG